MSRVKAFSMQARFANQTRRLWQSGVFDALSYIECQDDLRENFTNRSLLAMWHYCRHGRFEQREVAQGPVSRWLTPHVIEGRVGALSARRLLKAVPRGFEMPPEGVIEAFSRRHGLMAEEFWFVFHHARQDYQVAYKLLDQLPMEAAFLHHYASARRHLRLNRLMEAHRWSIAALDRPERRLVEFYVAAREIADAVGYEACPQPEFHRKLVAAFSEQAIVAPARKWAALWQVGYPYIPDGSKAAAKLKACLPSALYDALPTGMNDVYSTAEGWGPVLNAATLTQLTGEDHYVGWNGMEWQAIEPADPGNGLDVRIPWEGIWRHAMEQGMQRGLLAGLRSATLAVGNAGIPIRPCPATLIFDVRGAAGRPTLSYHTISNPDQRYLNYKESALPGYFMFDRTGYSGWATEEQIVPLADEIRPAVDTFFEMLKEKYVDGQLTKYKQEGKDDKKVRVPTGPFILVALQVPDDTVSALAHMTVAEMIEAVAAYAAVGGVKVVVKRHPHDRSGATQARLERLAATHENIVLNGAPIHALIKNARCVVTSNSGVGLEALLHLKPVITTGASDYGACTIQARTPTELQAALARLEQEVPDHMKPDAVKCWLHHYFTQRCFTPNSVPASFLAALEEIRKGGEAS